MNGDTVDRRVNINTEKDSMRSKPIPGLKPSPTKRIKFADGKILALNRKQRRQAHIYNKDLKPE